MILLAGTDSGRSDGVAPLPASFVQLGLALEHLLSQFFMKFPAVGLS